MTPRNQLVPIASTRCHGQIPLGPTKGRKYKIDIFTGLIVDHLEEVYGLDVKYEILEANDDNRLGGRLYTHCFDDSAEQPHPQLRLPPSYNIDDPVDKPGFLLALYTWSQEARRIGNLINNKSSDGETELKALLIDNLAQLHSSSKAEYDEVREIIEKNYETPFAYDWYAELPHHRCVRVLRPRPVQEYVPLHHY
ncbi:MAG: hypothetical protein LQ341_002859 [Variospora aurantia]|nr:MAG: hypothetical protein LQ341_002859 [Variospora aurantia]